MFRKLITFCLLFPMSFYLGFSTPDNIYDDLYSNSNRLFHIERSLNKNIVCYDLNKDINNEVNKKEPVHVYWVNREERAGQCNEIKFFQQKAFGYKVIETNINSIKFRLNALKNREITIEHNNNQQHICKTIINGQLSVLQKAYVKTKDNNSLQVEYIEISGITVNTETDVTERITP